VTIDSGMIASLRERVQIIHGIRNTDSSEFSLLCPLHNLALTDYDAHFHMHPAPRQNQVAWLDCSGRYLHPRSECVPRFEGSV
jgi:hypothetical protein